MAIALLILLSSVIHATWNYLSKTIPSGAPFVWLVAVLTSSFYLPVLVWWIYQYGFDFQWITIISMLFSAVIHTVYFLVLQHGYQVSDLSIVYPIARGSGPVFSTIGAFLLLGESGNIGSLFGLLLVVIGVLLIAGLKSPFSTDERIKKGLLYGIATGFLIAVYTLWDAYAVKYLAIAPIFVEYFSHPFRIVVLAPVALKQRKEIQEIWKNYCIKILIISIISPLSFVLVLYALKFAPIHYVAPTRELSIVIGVFLGGKLLAEKDFKMRLLGAGLILLGILFLSISK
jgi:drug/metabolite transporter (DMT)-like permease